MDAQRVNDIATSNPFKPDEELRGQFIESIPEAVAKLDQAIDVCYGLGLTAGWWHDSKTKEPKPERSYGDLTALFHSEISESFEAFRKGAPDDHLPQYPGQLVELADAVIRFFDFIGQDAERKQIFLNAMRDKLVYNTQRKDHKMDARAADGGKKL